VRFEASRCRRGVRGHLNCRVRDWRGLRGVLGPLDEWTIKVDTTGVWRVTYAQLAAKGFPVAQPVADLTLTRREWAGPVPPYVRCRCRSAYSKAHRHGGHVRCG
jgi:hypothetical protein